MSVLMDGVADDVVVPVRSVIRLLVRVLVELMVGTATPPIVAPVVKSGDVPNTRAPVPVSPVTAVAKLVLDGVARKVATPEPRPETPVEIGKPVALVRVTDAGVPSVGVTSVGDVEKTKLVDVVPVAPDAV